MYNPFWATMRSHPELNQSGTYYYSSGIYDRWSTFDQILLSSSWLNSGWKVVNEDALVVANEFIVGIVTSNRFKIDHLPVLVKLRKSYE